MPGLEYIPNAALPLPSTAGVVDVLGIKSSKEISAPFEGAVVSLVGIKSSKEMSLATHYSLSETPASFNLALTFSGSAPFLIASIALEIAASFCSPVNLVGCLLLGTVLAVA